MHPYLGILKLHLSKVTIFPMVKTSSYTVLLHKTYLDSNYILFIAYDIGVSKIDVLFSFKLLNTEYTEHTCVYMHIYTSVQIYRQLIFN